MIMKGTSRHYLGLGLGLVAGVTAGTLAGIAIGADDPFFIAVVSVAPVLAVFWLRQRSADAVAQDTGTDLGK